MEKAHVPPFRLEVLLNAKALYKPNSCFVHIQVMEITVLEFDTCKTKCFSVTFASLVSHFGISFNYCIEV